MQSLEYNEHLSHAMETGDWMYIDVVTESAVTVYYSAENVQIYPESANILYTRQEKEKVA